MMILVHCKQRHILSATYQRHTSMQQQSHLEVSDSKRSVTRVLFEKSDTDAAVLSSLHKVGF